MPCSVAKASSKLSDCTPARRLRLFLDVRPMRRRSEAAAIMHAHQGMKQASKELNHHHALCCLAFTVATHMCL